MREKKKESICTIFFFMKYYNYYTNTSEVYNSQKNQHKQ